MPTVGQFLISRLKNVVGHVFGVPGDYNLSFYEQLCKQMPVIGTTDEECAGFAADAYARIRGFGCVAVTYCVGGFKVLNPLAGAYAEKSPVLLLSGSPGMQERNSDYLLHHMAGAFESQHKIFKNITCAHAILDDPFTAGYEIDRVIAAIQHFKQPGYIELPRDMVNRNIKYDVYGPGIPEYRSNAENFSEVMESAIDWIRKSKNPVILAGVEVARFGLGRDLIAFAEANNIPVACTFLGKSVVDETHPLFLGVYCGGMSEEFVRKTVEESDCVLMLGVMQTDMNLAFQPMKCNQTNVIFVNTSSCRIRRSIYEKINFSHFATEILKTRIERKPSINICRKNIEKFVPVANTPIAVARLFAKINNIIRNDMCIIADVGDSLFGASDLTIHDRNHFLASAFYASMGFAVPAALGASFAEPKTRPIVLVGDGAFQMTGMELSTLVRHKINAIVFILNNKGYTTERFLIDGPFNDIQNWDYYNVPSVIGGGHGYHVKTEQDLEEAVEKSLDNKALSIIQVDLDKLDTTPALRRMTENLSRKINDERETITS